MICVRDYAKTSDLDPNNECRMIFPMKILIRYQTLSILNSMLNLQNNNVISNNQILGSSTL